MTFCNFLAGQVNLFQDGTLFPGGLGTCISAPEKPVSRLKELRDKEGRKTEEVVRIGFAGIFSNLTASHHSYNVLIFNILPKSLLRLGTSESTQRQLAFL